MLNMKTKTPTPELLHKMDAHWRVCYVLSLTIEKEHDYENKKSV